MDTRWEAIYNDGSKLSQVKEDGSASKYTDIDRSRLVQFVLHRNVIPAVVVHLDPGKRLIYRRLVAFTPPDKNVVVYLVGWQETRAGQNFQCVSFLFEDGHIEILDGFRKGHFWFDAPNFLKEEEVISE